MHVSKPDTSCIKTGHFCDCKDFKQLTFSVLIFGTGLYGLFQSFVIKKDSGLLKLTHGQSHCKKEMEYKAVNDDRWGAGIVGFDLCQLLFHFGKIKVECKYRTHHDQ